MYLLKMDDTLIRFFFLQRSNASKTDSIRAGIQNWEAKSNCEVLSGHTNQINSHVQQKYLLGLQRRNNHLTSFFLGQCAVSGDFSCPNGTGRCHADHVRLGKLRTEPRSGWAGSGFPGVLRLSSPGDFKLEQDKEQNASRLGQFCCGLQREHCFGSIRSPICQHSGAHGAFWESTMLSAKKILNQIHLVFSVNNLLFSSSVSRESTIFLQIGFQGWLRLFSVFY